MLQQDMFMHIISPPITIGLLDRSGLWDVIYLHTTVLWHFGGRFHLTSNCVLEREDSFGVWIKGSMI